ncbi:MAG TPA: potassium-transporting ATPase subunit C [Microbacterium sp.]|uniref:potassium-transporting ATPase subunit C n=1 Tax=Microbacterium sp. TaxID=51671 RepID=UPI002CB88498|nr:potassium-transporting ATPase subunit C [Microbacterium sp.]HWI30681.1 potassium-transporting ATPase subunit C [Microbacterium sp.]
MRNANLRATGVAVRAMIVFTVVLGIGYMLLVTAIGQVTMPWQSNGSPVQDADGTVVGSSLIGQSFTVPTPVPRTADAPRGASGRMGPADGDPLPEWFQSRPSAAGDGYDGGASSGTNQGPENADLIAAIDERKTAISELDDVDPADIPADAVTASASGLDPDISPAYALLQVERVAKARGLRAADVRELVESRIQARDAGYLGEPRVNVLELNLALEALQG